MSKKSWTRLMDFCRFGSNSERSARFRYLFHTHHQYCDEFVHGRDGNPLAAVYFTHETLHRIDTKAIMRAIQERVLYGYEQEEFMPEKRIEKAAMEIICSLPNAGLGCVVMDPFHLQDLKNKIVAALEAAFKPAKKKPGA